MLTADEARKIATNKDKTISKQFEEIEKYINEAVFNGEFSVHIAGVLHPYVKEYLKNIGYMINTCESEVSAYSFYTISWLK